MALNPTSTAPIASEPAPGSTQSPLSPDSSTVVPFWRSVVILIVTAFVGLTYFFNPPMNVVPKAGVVMDLPVIVGDYFGKLGEASDVELHILPKDTEFARRYYDDGLGHQINCSIVLSGAEERSIHRPEGCLTGQGWTVTGQDDIPIPLPSGHKLVARKLSLSRQVTADNGDPVTLRAFYIYWFVGQNVTTPSHFTRILLSNWDRVIHNRAHRWAYVSVFALITENVHVNGLNPQQTQDMLVNFATQIVPTFQISEMADPPKQ